MVIQSPRPSHARSRPVTPSHAKSRHAQSCPVISQVEQNIVRNTFQKSKIPNSKEIFLVVNCIAARVAPTLHQRSVLNCKNGQTKTLGYLGILAEEELRFGGFTLDSLDLCAQKEQGMLALGLKRSWRCTAPRPKSRGPVDASRHSCQKHERVPSGAGREGDRGGAQVADARKAGVRDGGRRGLGRWTHLGNACVQSHPEY